MERELIDIALINADEIGQKEQLKKLFDKYPESKANYWAVIDFNKSSNEKRFFIFNLKNRSFEAYLVAHGKIQGSYMQKNSPTKLGLINQALVYTKRRKHTRATTEIHFG